MAESIYGKHKEVLPAVLKHLVSQIENYNETKKKRNRRACLRAPHLPHQIRRQHAGEMPEKGPSARAEVCAL